MVFCEYRDQVLLCHVVYQHFFSQLLRHFFWHLDLQEILVQLLSHIYSCAPRTLLRLSIMAVTMLAFIE